MKPILYVVRALPEAPATEGASHVPTRKPSAPEAEFGNRKDGLRRGAQPEDAVKRGCIEIFTVQTRPVGVSSQPDLPAARQGSAIKADA